LPFPTRNPRLPSPSPATDLPKHVARLRQAQAHFARGELRDAEALCERVLRKRPSDFDALYLLAGVRHALGKLPEALDALARALRVNPRSPQILVNHGLLLATLGRRDEALASYDRATAISGDFAEAHSGRGCVLLDMERPDEALACFDKALAVRPSDPDALSNRGSALMKLRRYAEALSSCDRALALRPGDVRAMCNRAHALQALGRHAEALAGYDAVLALDPAHARAMSGRGVALNRLGRWDEAIAACDRAVALEPHNADAWSNRGNAFMSLDRPDDALASYASALAINPHHLDALTNRGVALLRTRDAGEALASHDRALALDPLFANAWSNRSAALRWQGRTVEAIADCDRALAIDPDHVTALINRSCAFFELGRLDQAIADRERALTINPDNVDARFGKSMIQLLRGDLSDGWKEYESRLKVVEFGHWRVTYDKPRWTGEPIEGRTILLHAEQGLGDTIQFLRYARLMAAKARVILGVQRPLLRLASRIGEIAQVVVPGDRLPDFDFHCPLMSLPLAFNTTLETIPRAVPYLDADAAQVAAWRRRLDGLPGLKVGLVWAGGTRPELPIQHSMDQRRSITLAHFAAFAGMTGVTFVSLQKDGPAAQANSPPQGLVVHDWTNELGDFVDTAALIAALDLVISVDTSVAHLAGALGKPVWLLNRVDTDWRWLLDRDDSPWYPTLRQFRQDKPGEWEPALSRVRGALAELAVGKAHGPRWSAAQMKESGAFSESAATEHAPPSPTLGRDPKQVIAWVGRGNAHVTEGCYREAVADYDAAIAIDKNNVDAWTNRGVALQNDRRVAEAIASHDRALSLQPRCANAWDNRAGALLVQGRTCEAIADYGRALAIEPDRAGTLCNRSGALRELGRLDEAAADLDRALAIDPAFAEARFGRSTIRLLRGDLNGAWAEYESRLKVREFGHWRRTFDKPRWTGEPIEGRTLLLHAEQGLGDTIQFVRYARLVAAKVAAKSRVVLEVQRPLVRLASRMGEFAAVVAAGDRLPDFDLHCPLLSLPLAFGTTLETIPRAVPYLDADAAQVAEWRRRLAGLPGLKVGLAWAGGFRPELPIAHAMDRRRSVTLAHFAAFAGMTGVSLVSLQKDAPAAQTRSPPDGLVVHDWTDELGDFADTAALVEALDLVISVDTSVAHLAGALGKPVWLLNRFDSEWRWLLDRNDSPWYPTLRQFRQVKPGEWEPVLSRVRDALAELAAGA
jgi:tetratricopeptide (TPR) repeat protein